MNQKQLLTICALFLAGPLWAQPSNNPFLARYPSAGASHWTNALRWTNVVNVTTFGATANDNSDDLAAVNQAIEAAHAAGGGVVYFPAGVYTISDSIILKSGVILRGDDPTIPDAKTAGYLPPSRLEFPEYIHDTTANGGLGNPVSSAFKVICGTRQIQNAGVVNLDVNRARIEFFPDFDSLGMRTNRGNGALIPNYQPRQQNRNLIVFGVRSNNASYPNPALPDLSGPNKMRPWQRYYTPFVSNIDLYLAENAIVANNRLNDQTTDNFEQPGYRVRNTCTGCTNYKNIGQPGDAAWNASNYVPVLNGRHAYFDYTAHYGISVNRNKMVFINGRRDIKPMMWYPDPQEEPSLYAPGFVIEDNWIYKTNRVGIWCAGMGMVIRGNVIRDSVIAGSTTWATPKAAFLDTRGIGVNRNASATFENRGIDFGGSDILIENNDVQVSTMTFPELGYGSVDGEGIMDQGNGGGTNPNGLIIRNNQVAGNRDDCTNPTIGLYRTLDINNVLYEGNIFTGNSRCMQIETTGGGYTMTNVLVRNNTNLKTLIMVGHSGGFNARAHDNVGTSGGGQMRLSCFVQAVNNQALTIQPSGCTQLAAGGLDTTDFPRVAMAVPNGDLVLGAPLPTLELKAVLMQGQADSIVFFLNAVERLGRGTIQFDTAYFNWTMPVEDGTYYITAVAYYKPTGANRSYASKSAFSRVIIDDGDALTNNPKDVLVANAPRTGQNQVLRLYPNPASAQVTLLADGRLDQVQVLDLLGHSLLSTSSAGNHLQLDVSALPRGIYGVRTSSQGRTGLKRLVID